MARDAWTRCLHGRFGRLTRDVGSVNAVHRDRYALHGLVVESPLALDAPTVTDAPDLRVHLAEPRDVRDAPEGKRLAELHLGAISHWVCELQDDPARWLLRYPGVADFEIDRAGGTIAVHPGPDGASELLGLLLAGSVMAYLLSGDGELVLHASAIEVSGSALAIVGPSGAGKSTLAAALCGAGAALVSDDTLRVGLSSRRIECFRGTNRVRLRSSAGELARMEGAVVVETVDGRLGVAPRQTSEPRLPLDGVVIPVPSREAPALEVERLGTRDALLEILRVPRVAGWVDPDRLRAHFDGCAELAEAVPVHRATVPWGPPFDAGLGSAILESVDFAPVAER
jgi:hypothetical protein